MIDRMRSRPRIFRVFSSFLVGFFLLGIVLLSKQSMPALADQTAAIPQDPENGGSVIFTKVDTLLNDLLSNGEANPGDTIQYTTTISNATISDMTNAVLTDTLDSNVTMIPNSLSTTPIAYDDTAVTIENSSVNIPLTGNDPDGDTLTFSVISGPAKGSLGAIIPQTATSATVIYTPTAAFIGSDSFTFQVEDDNAHTDIGTISVTVNLPVNYPPALDLDADDNSGATGANYNTAFVEEGGAVSVSDTDVVVTDDGGSLVIALITLINHPDGSDENLSVNGALPGGLVASIDTSGHAITLTGSTTPANYQTAIRQIEYNNISNNPTETNRTATVVVNDGTNDSNTATATISVTASNDAAVLDLDTDDSSGATGNDFNGSFVEDAGAVQLSDGISITDVDNANLISATITLTNPLNTLSETLSINTGLATGFGITVMFGANNHSIDLSGAATLDKYRQVLETVMYDNASDTPDTTTRTVTFVVNDGAVNSNTATANITVTAVNDPPGATDDTYNNVVGNTLFAVGAAMPPTPVVTVTGSVLDNDTDPEMGGLTIDSFDNPSVQGGTVVMQGDGTFTYLPPLGYEGVDNFDYIVTDGIDTQTATVNLTVTDVVWYIDNTAAGGGDGRSQTPFNNLADFRTAQASAGANDPQIEDYIYIYEGTGDSTNLTGGIILLDDQQLIGQGVDLIVGGNTLVTAVANPILTNGAGNGVTLASGNTIRGLTVDNTGGAGITGNSVGNLTVSSTAVANTGEVAVSINTGTLNAAFTTLSSTNSSAQGINLNNVSGTFTVSGSTVVSGSSSDGIVVQGSGGLTADFGNTALTNVGADGVDLSNNAGSSFTFDTLNITTTGGRGLIANNSGTVNVTGSNNTIDTTVPGSAGAVNIINTTIGSSGITFLSINANGGDTGITLNNSGGGSFTVTGSGTTDGSGGTLQNLNDHGIELINAQNVTISNMNLINAALTAEVATNSATCTDLANGTNIGCNAPVHMGNASNISLTNLTINGSEQHGVNGNNVVGLTISNTDLSNIGDDNKENGMHFINLLGTVSFSNISVIGADTRNVLIENNSGTANITITNSTIDNAGSEVGLDFLGLGTADISFSVTDSSFTHNNASQLKALAEDSSTIEATITGNTFDGDPNVVGNVGIDLAVRDGGNLTFDIIGTTGNPQTFQPIRGHAINVFASGGGTASGTIDGNVINESRTGAGVRVVAQVTDINGFNPAITVAIQNNTINNVQGAGLAGIHIESRDGTSGLSGVANVQATLNNNSVTINGADSVIQALINSGNSLCLDVTNNSAAGAATSPFAGFGSTHYIGNPFAGSSLGSGNVTYGGYIAGDLGSTWNNNGNSPMLAAGITGEAYVDGTQPTNGTCATPALLPNTETSTGSKLLTKTFLTTKTAAMANVNLNLGSLPAGKEMTVTFEVTINDPFPTGVTQISNQAQISAAGLGVLLSDDPDTGAVNDATVTLVSQILTTYLPLIMHNFRSLPDLVVNSVDVSASGVAVVVENIGSAPAVDNFWVDVYIDPNPPPMAVNQTWPMLGNQGLVWGVTTALDPGTSLTLTIGDTYYQSGLSNFSGNITPGTAVYAQVDSANLATTYGAVLEKHEFYNTAYNNIGSTIATSFVFVSGEGDTVVSATNLPTR